MRVDDRCLRRFAEQLLAICAASSSSEDGMSSSDSSMTLEPLSSKFEWKGFTRNCGKEIANDS